MPLSWNEIKTRAATFAQAWADASDERAQAQEFWLGFFDIFGVRKPRVASFEHAVKKYGGKQGFIDLFWPGTLLVEHKSRGKSLERAHTQALDYFAGLKERDLPRYVLVSDFARLRLYDLERSDEPSNSRWPTCPNTSNALPLWRATKRKTSARKTPSTSAPPKKWARCTTP